MAAPLTSMTFADGNILASRRVPITTIVINRAEVKNTLDAKSARGLAGAFQIADADEEIRAVVLTGAGGSFCSGADVKELAAASEYFAWAGTADGPLRVPMSKPLIAAIEGHAVAEGLGLALFCDIRIIDDTTVFGAFARDRGVPIGDGTTARLARLVGLGRALDMILTGRSVSADEAMAMGLASRKVMHGKARLEAEKLALEIADLPQATLLAERRLVYDNLNLDLATALQREVEQAQANFSDEAKAEIARRAQRTPGIRLLRA